MASSPLRLALVTTAIGLATAAPAGAAEQTHLHVLDGHAFLPMFHVDTPFAQSTALVGVGYASASFDNLDLGAFSPRVEGQAAIGKGFAVSLRATANVITGLNTDSAVQYGASSS